MIAVTFALPQESNDFRRELREVGGAPTPGRNRLLGRIRDEQVLVGHTGVGCAAAGRELRDILREHRPTCVISAGFAGGLDPRLEAGSLLVATNLSDSELIGWTRALLTSERCFFGALHTAAVAVESAEDKARLALATGALAVDMETSELAAICREACIPFLSLRVISDAASTSLPVPFSRWFDLHRQRPRPLGLLAYLAFHPAKIRPFYDFVRGLEPARTRLSGALVKLVSATGSRTQNSSPEFTRAS